MPIRLLQIDAFTAAPFGGNPAAVCLLPAPRPAAWMQAVAAEMNLSETAFLLARDDGAFDLRWFTPTVEVDLCGHATLASAHALWEEGRLAPDEPARFHTRSGVLTARREGQTVRLDFPADPPRRVWPGSADESDAERFRRVAEALGAEPIILAEGKMLLAELPDEQAVRNLRPDMARLRAVGGFAIVTARSDEPAYDFVSRFFAPAAGVDEDPVTGAAHCTLGPYWQGKTGRSDFTAFQASSRGGVVAVSVAGERVHLGGQAVTVLRGELLPDD